jgi:hypothetical protein
MGLVFPAWHLRPPDGTGCTPSGSRLAHFERVLHDTPPEWRLRGNLKPVIFSLIVDKINPGSY